MGACDWLVSSVAPGVIRYLNVFSMTCLSFFVCVSVCILIYFFKVMGIFCE